MFSLSHPLCSLVELYIIVLFVRAIFSWFPIRSDSPVMPFVRFAHMVTEPVLAPVRRVIPAAGMFDLSFIVVFVVLQFVIQPIVCRVA